MRTKKRSEYAALVRRLYGRKPLPYVETVIYYIHEVKARINMTLEDIKKVIMEFVPKYSIVKVTLFGSRAAGTYNDDSDVDLIIEFSNSVTLITLSQIKIEMEEVLGLDVDIIHGPITENDMIEIGEVIVLYAA